MDEPIPIGRKRFAEATEQLERSKSAVLAENEHLKEQRSSMAQLLAAILVQFGEESIHLRRKFQLTFEVSDLESYSPDIVGLEIVDGKAVLFLK